MDYSTRTNGLIVAAGMSRRMGDFKPLMPFQGKTVIEKTIDSMLNSGVAQVVVVLGYRGEEIERLLRSRYLGELVLTYNPRYAATDMLESVKCGLRALPDCGSFFLLPGDMPAIQTSTFIKLLQAKNTDFPAILFPAIDGYRKHPPLIDSFFIPVILEYLGECGLRQLWRQLESHIVTVPVEDQGVCMDLDTRGDYESCMEYFCMNQEKQKEDFHVQITY